MVNRSKPPRTFRHYPPLTMPRHQERRELAAFLFNRKRHQAARIEIYMQRLTAREIRAALDQTPADIFSSPGEDSEDRFECALAIALLDKNISPNDLWDTSATAAKPDYFAQSEVLRSLEDLL